MAMPPEFYYPDPSKHTPGEPYFPKWAGEWEHGCQWSLPMIMSRGCFVFLVNGVFCSNLGGLFLYVYIEKPAIEARRVFN